MRRSCTTAALSLALVARSCNGEARAADPPERAAAPIATGSPTLAGLPLPRPTLAEPNEPARVQPLDAASDVVAPRLPTPFLLPELAHPRIDTNLAWTLGSVLPRTATGSGVSVGLVQASVEAHVLLFRRFYVGADVPVALGRAVPGAKELTSGPSGSRPEILPGNLGLHARIVFPMPSWLAFGAVFGLAVPTAGFDRNGPAAAAARAAVAVAPTDVPLFLPGRLTWRPAFDVRILRGPFVVQVRQGVDIVQDVSTGGARTQGRILAHAGVLVSRDVELSFEGQQLYRFDGGPEVSDKRRSAIVVGPAARVSVGRFDLGGMIASSVLDAIGTEMESVLAVQASVVAHLP